MSSKARNLSDFISDPAIDSTELGDGSVTTAKLGDQAVTPAKLHNTLDLSSKTVTLATDGISGNSVHGGVISDFASTGIDDNASATAITIDSSGNVGVGTASPTEKLVIKGDGARLTVESADMEVAMLGRRGSSGSALDSGYLRLRRQSVTADGVVIDTDGPSWFNGGNVGIGTTNPAAQLHVYSAGQAISRVEGDNQYYTGMMIRNNYAGQQSQWHVAAAGGTSGWGAVNGNFIIRDDTTNSTGIEIERGAGGASGALYIDSSGRVLIGTTSQAPNTNGNLTINQGSDTTPALQFTSGDTNWWGRTQHSVEGGTIATFISSAGSWSQNGTTTNVVKDYDGSFPSAGLMMYNQYGGTKKIGFRFLRKNEGSTTTDGTVEEVAAFTEDQAYIHTGIGHGADTNETTWLNGSINSLTLRVNSRPDYTSPGMAGIKFRESGWSSPVANMLITSFSGDGTEKGYLSSWKFITKAGGSADNYNTALTISGGGSLSKLSGSFRIDHPLPEKTDTHHLVHSFVEAPQADNLYRGRVDLVNGQATVNLDTASGMTEGTFALLNRDLQCFTTNESGWTLVRGSITGNQLTIEAQDAACTDTVSWLVIGERQDKHMFDTDWTDSDGHVIVEPLKEVEQPE